MEGGTDFDLQVLEAPAGGGGDAAEKSQAAPKEGSGGAQSGPEAAGGQKDGSDGAEGTKEPDKVGTRTMRRFTADSAESLLLLLGFL